MTESATFLDPPGVPVDGDALTAQKARDLLAWLCSDEAAYAHFVECRQVDTTSPGAVVVFDVDVELPQRLINDIRRCERVAVTFDTDDHRTPEILALRSDFPWVRHLNLGPKEYPRSLCVYEEKNAEVRMDWTTVDFVERIRAWFARTAIDHLHGTDQALEAFLPDLGWSIVLPPDIVTLSAEDVLRPLPVTAVQPDNQRLVLLGRNAGPAMPPDAAQHVATIFIGSPQPHGPIPKIPANLRDLRDFLSRAGIDLLDSLRSRLRTWITQTDRRLADSKLIVVAILPLTRDPSGGVVATSLMSFVSTRTVREIGACLDLWDPASLGVHIEVDLTRDGADVPVVVLNTHCELSRSHAARLAGLLGADDRAITAIGLGALGSQAFDILHRMGWGRWTLIDDDLLFPHNLARHQLNSNAIGWPKALALATSTTDTLCDDEVRFVVADVIDPRDKAEAVRDSLHNADIILDMSASISVARFLASDVASTGRRTSVFLNPTGTDSVLLVENETRTAPLDWLKMQYYRTLITQPGLQRHLRDRRGAVPYAHTCRDVSSVIPQELVALHAALTARGLRLALDRAEGTITIWQTEDDDTVVRRHQVDATPAIDHRSQGWLVRTDQEFVNKVNDLRMAASRAGHLYRHLLLTAWFTVAPPLEPAHPRPLPSSGPAVLASIFRSWSDFLRGT